MIESVGREPSMRMGTVTFPGDAGKHEDKDGKECSGRAFTVKSVGVGGVYTNVVVCMACRCELAAYEDRIAGRAPYSTTA